jgi:hypothetical protein
VICAKASTFRYHYLRAYTELTWEKVWILELELVFSFPGVLCSTTGFPANLNYVDSASLEFLDFSVYDFYWLFHKLKLVIEPDFFEMDYHILLEQAFLEV